MCENKVLFYTPKGNAIRLQCGRTGMQGERVICEECRSSPDAMRSIDAHEESIRADNAWSASAGWGDW